MKPSIPIVATLLAAASLHGGTPVMPGPMPAPVESEWRFRFAPYLWLAAIDGDIGMGRFTLPIDISISDTLDNLDLAYMFQAEVGYGRWSLTADFVYGDFSNYRSRSGLINRIDYSYTQWVLTATLGYRVIETDTYAMDVFAGTRTTDIEASATAFLPFNRQLQANRSDRWTDPIIGIRGQAALGDRFMMRYNADIGGFGASSDFVWQAFLGFGYNITQNATFVVGYRAMGVDYSSDQFSTFDLINHGPLVGFEFRF